MNNETPEGRRVDEAAIDSIEELIGIGDCIAQGFDMGIHFTNMTVAMIIKSVINRAMRKPRKYRHLMYHAKSWRVRKKNTKRFEEMRRGKL
jgi:hypothetical protein